MWSVLPQLSPTHRAEPLHHPFNPSCLHIGTYQPGALRDCLTKNCDVIMVSVEGYPTLLARDRLLTSDAQTTMTGRLSISTILPILIPNLMPLPNLLSTPSRHYHCPVRRTTRTHCFPRHLSPARLMLAGGRPTMFLAPLMPS